MRIIFLDFFGVMDGSLETENADWKEWSDLDPKCGELIQKLCQDYDAKIIITSDSVQECHGAEWQDRIEKAYRRLTDCGISREYILGYIYQSTESISFWDRPTQIKKWIIENQPDDYVIFDDLPLLFQEKDILKYEEEINEWAKTKEYKEKWIARLPEPNPEAAKRFIKVNPKDGLTKKDYEMAKRIFENKGK